MEAGHRGRSPQRRRRRGRRGPTWAGPIARRCGGRGTSPSEETLGSFRDADFETYTEITDTFARWGAIDVRYRGRTVRSRGHVFSAIARKRLLQILQDRCRRLGVGLVFHREVGDLSELGDV